MSPRREFLVWLVVAGAAGCGSEVIDETNQCENKCAAVGDARCDGDVLDSCVEGDDGCLEWQPTDCAADDGVCGTIDGKAECIRCDRGARDSELTTIMSSAPVTMAGYTSVTGSLSIEDAPSLEGLECLEHVGGGLFINRNPALDGLGSLRRLRTIGGNLHIGETGCCGSSGGQPKGNDALEHLDGLTALSSIGGDLLIGANEALTSVDALMALGSFSGQHITIVSNPVLPTCEATRLADHLIALGFVGEPAIDGNDDAGICP